jgi:hypothetical protein
MSPTATRTRCHGPSGVEAGGSGTQTGPAPGCPGSQCMAPLRG